MESTIKERTEEDHRGERALMNFWVIKEISNAMVSMKYGRPRFVATCNKLRYNKLTGSSS